MYNPFFYEGTKTYIYEVYEQIHRIPANIFVPLGNGTLFIGVVKALEELLESAVIDKMPNIIAVQSEYCEHTTAASYAAYLKYCELHGKTSDCLISMCGAGLKSDH